MKPPVKIAVLIHWRNLTKENIAQVSAYFSRIILSIPHVKFRLTVKGWLIKNTTTLLLHDAGKKAEVLVVIGENVTLGIFGHHFRNWRYRNCRHYLDILQFVFTGSQRPVAYNRLAIEHGVVNPVTRFDYTYSLLCCTQFFLVHFLKFTQNSFLLLLLLFLYLLL